MKAGRGPAGRSVREVLGLRDTPVRIPHTPQHAVRRNDADGSAGVILDGLAHVARSSRNGRGDGDGDGDDGREDSGDGFEATMSGSDGGLLVSKTNRLWSGVFLSRDDVDYSEVFGRDIASTPGVSAWRIEYFRPVPYDLTDGGASGKATLASGDCYIILCNRRVSSDDVYGDYSTELSIHYWIGRSSTLDKKVITSESL